MVPPTRKQKTVELRFKFESLGTPPENDDDLETCPSRTRSSWPRQIIPWWKPSDPNEKPPYSYATLIAHAILTSKDGRLTLSDIYKWISEYYPYYKKGEKGWQNSIRHNLSLNKKWFVKLDRRPTQTHPGKGGYWTLQINMEKLFVENLSQAGGHSRRHHDMGMYSSMSSPYYSTSDSDKDHENISSDFHNVRPFIHITRPKDYEVKKNKCNISAPRMRNMSSQEKVSSPHSVAPKTDPKSFIIRFNSPDPSRRRRTDCQKNKRRYSDVCVKEEDEEDEDSLDIYKRARYCDSGVDSPMESPLDCLYNFQKEDFNMIRPKDLMDNFDNLDYINFMHELQLYEPELHYANTYSATNDSLLLTSCYSPIIDNEAQNILNGLQRPAENDMKTINLQSNALNKTIHCDESFSIDQFSDPTSKKYIPGFSTYNIEQYIDLGDCNKSPTTDISDDTLGTLYANWSNSFDIDSYQQFML
ncbi:fork head domain-containing protein [Pilobolus umbonatus]|nr:fork head domain-containing protein [Pilobolus umbonatus]